MTRAEYEEQHEARNKALQLLCRWHNWICSGQLNFRTDHLDESEAVLKACGLPYYERTEEEKAELKSLVKNHIIEPFRT